MMVTAKEYMVDSMPGGVSFETMIKDTNMVKPCSKTKAKLPPITYSTKFGIPMFLL